MKKVLVAGGAGFIGSHLCEKLINQGNHVTCLDNFFTGNKSKVEDLISNPNFELIDHDVIEPYSNTVDEIFNLACPASPIHYQVDPIKTIKTSVLGAMNMLGLAKNENAKILQASTSEVYGEPEIHPQHEEYWGNVNPIGKRSCYNEGKRCAESLFINYHTQHNLKIKIIRIFNTYGPKMDVDDGRVISNFVIQALKGQDITIYGDGKQTRSFQYVDDLVNGMIQMMNTPDEFTGPVNIGNPEEYTMLELVQFILELTNSKSKLIFYPLPEDDPKRRRPNIDLAREKFENWEPKIKLREGLIKTGIQQPYLYDRTSLQYIKILIYNYNNNIINSLQNL